MFRKPAFLNHWLEGLKSKKSFGNEGEKFAARYLKKQGFEIVESNYRCKIGELDIVARKKGRIHFVEVKTRSFPATHGLPEESVDFRKQRKITQVAKWYIKDKKMTDISISFSVLAVMRHPEGWQCKFIENAFDAAEGV